MAIALIPARAGSTRVPHKNVRMFAGKPMIYWPMEEAVRSGLFTEVIVSTDSQEYKDIVLRKTQSYGARLSVDMRPESLCRDSTPLEAVLAHAMELHPKEEWWCMILATAYWMDERYLLSGRSGQCTNAVLSVSVVRDRKSADRAMIVRNGRLVPLDRSRILRRTQDVRDSYHDCGGFYWVRRQPFLSKWRRFRKDILLQGPRGVPVGENAHMPIDIDTEDDWVMAEKEWMAYRA